MGWSVGYGGLGGKPSAILSALRIIYPSPILSLFRSVSLVNQDTGFYVKYVS